MHKFISENGQPGKVYIDFVNTTDFNEKALSDEARAMCEKDTNAGGNSEISEGVSYETFHRVGYAKHVKTENEIKKQLGNGPIVDYVCKIYGKTVAVSVTRAMNVIDDYPDHDIRKYRGPFTEKDAQELLKKKLEDIAVATTNQKQLDHFNPKWEKEILHVWVQNEETANIVSRVATDLLAKHRYNTLVVISKAETSDFIFTNDFAMLKEASKGKRKRQEQEVPEDAKQRRCGEPGKT